MCSRSYLCFVKLPKEEISKRRIFFNFINCTLRKKKRRVINYIYIYEVVLTRVDTAQSRLIKIEEN